MMSTDVRSTPEQATGPVTGLPVWYFVLAGLLVASFDIGQQYAGQYPWLAALPLAVGAVHLTLWFTLLSRRRRYIRSVWRSPRARLLVVGLALVRVGLQLGLTRLTDEVTALHTYAHLIMGLVMLVLITAGAWFDQWLILRTLNKAAETKTEEWAR